jgi:hypothetical protein
MNDYKYYPVTEKYAMTIENWYNYIHSRPQRVCYGITGFNGFEILGKPKGFQAIPAHIW